MPPNYRDDQIRYMSVAGIRTAVLQAGFLDYDYVKQTNQTCDYYLGQALYPSQAYPTQYPNFTDKADKLEAILNACDHYGVRILVGVGLFAWFDMRSESLCWHQKVFDELYTKYGLHMSIIGWYVSEEMFGSFLYNTPQFWYPMAVESMVKFFDTFSAQVHAKNPLHFVAFACNSQDFGNWLFDWERVLKHVDLLLPFGFARDSSFDTLAKVEEACEVTGTRLWVDMELFQYPIGPDGLVPKPVADVINEITDLYPSVQNVVGYEFTGLMDSPYSRLHLGGEAAAQMYTDYLDYYAQQLQG
eukprot:TRINITY_DN2258_c0_g1_i5.p1 TRINITY_DN2258_c0_g1~~TRINITY_DN2258_c0_g1_i5.p1  ORF type:complete len:301 (+),score=76.48 TRINITY_DN2258_c0_g1_i5:554-1456(+)